MLRDGRQTLFLLLGPMAQHVIYLPATRESVANPHPHPGISLCTQQLVDVFQAIMPLIGYFIGKSFITFIESFDHWIAFAILAIIGINMVRESFSKEEVDPGFSAKAMLILALATSIDALTMGLSFSMVDLRVNIFVAVTIIGVITFVLSGLGVFIGNIFGSRFNKIAQIIGGVCLVLIGVKVLLDGLGVL